jgi:lactoylglutathione lyase
MQIVLGNVNLYVRDIERARHFYTNILGLLENQQRSFPPTFILLDSGSCTITLQDSSAPGAVFGKSDSVELGFAVDDIEAVRERLKTQGIAVSDIQQMGWGGGFDAVDPDGHRLTIYQMRDEN